MKKYENIIGRYIYLTIDEIEYRVYYEEAGEGIPLLLGHPAGADGSHYRHILCDEEITKNFRCIVYDLPYHGKSLPPHGVKWWTKEYKLTREFAMDFPNALSEALNLDQPAYMGIATGGHLAVDLALYYPDKYRATIGVETAMRSAKEFRDVGMEGYRWEHDNPNINRASSSAAVVMHIAPQTSEENARELMWEYMCSGPGIFAGDLYYYYYDHHVTPEQARSIDTSKCMLYLLTGEYDPNTPPTATQELADLVKGSKFWTMSNLGHFPVKENYEEFKKYFMPILDEIKQKSLSSSTVR